MFTKILIDLGTGSAAGGVNLVSPLVNKLFAPFLDFPSYFLTMSRPEAQFLSWLAWLCTAWIIYALIRLKGPLSRKILPLLRGLIVTAVSFILFIAYCILCPLPQDRLISGNPGEIFLDLHSHTIYSHDGIVTPERNFRWHINSGFSGWATTEHDRIGNAPSIQRKLIEKNTYAAAAIAGEEINFKKVHLNLIGIKEDFDAKAYRNLADLINDVHRLGGAVIIPHYWAETRSPFSMQDLAEAGADAFEITGNSSVPLTQQTQQEIINLCREKGLVMLSGTNWHGWRNSCNVWTGFNAPGWKRMDTDAREKTVIDALRNRETGRFRVIEYRQKDPAAPNHLLEPFTCLFSYFTSIDTPRQISWLFWIATFWFVFHRLKNRRMAAIILWEVVTLILLIKSVLIFNTWKTVSGINEILPEISKVLLATAVLTTFLSLSNLLKKGKNRNT